MISKRLKRFYVEIPFEIDKNFSLELKDILFEKFEKLKTGNKKEINFDVNNIIFLINKSNKSYNKWFIVDNEEELKKFNEINEYAKKLKFGFKKFILLLLYDELSKRGVIDEPNENGN